MTAAVKDDKGEWVEIKEVTSISSYPAKAYFRQDSVGPEPLTVKSPVRLMLMDRDHTRRRVLLPRKDHPRYYEILESAERDGLQAVEAGSSVMVSSKCTEELKEWLLREYDITVVEE